LTISLNFFFYLIRAVLKEKEDKRKTLVIICLHRLGDTVFCISAIDEIFNNFEGYKKYILTFKETADILKLKFQDDNIIKIDSSEIIFHGRFATKKARNIIKNLNPSYIIDLTGTPASASLIFNKPATKIVGMNLIYFKNIYTDFITKRIEPHFIDNYLDVARLIIPDLPSASNYEFNTNIDPNCKIILHPFAIRKAKEWNFRKFIELALRLKENYLVEIISPKNFIAADVYEELVGVGLNCRITESITDLISQIRQASVFISNDSGPTYIAALLGKPTFTIYGPTNPRYSLPFGKFQTYYQKQMICSANNEMFCFTLGGIECPTNECINNISVDTIEAKVLEFIDALGIIKKR
jgi:ADP-heptose:LPS heptosyltransferase